MDDTPLASLSLTHVRYNPADRLSLVSAYLALVPQALCIIYVTLIWSTREIEIILMFAGQMSCELLNFGLKRWIREERPQQMHGKGYGMPSSHSQFVAYFAVSLSLFLLFRHQPHPHPAATSTTGSPPTSSQPSSLQSLPSRLLLSAVAIFTASSVAMSRIYLMYHTPKQVLVGIAAGTFFAALWFAFTSFLRREGWIEWSLEFSIARWFRIKDLVLYEDPWDAGWGRFEERRMIMRREKRA